MRRSAATLVILSWLPTLALASDASGQTTRPSPLGGFSAQAFFTENCVDCHHADDPSGGLDLSTARMADDLTNSNLPWEKIIRRLRTRQMPPPEADRPDEAEYVAALGQIEAALDAAAEAHPQPGRPPSLRRLTRTEYRNAIRDLLALDFDVDAVLPADQESHGFDNVTVDDLSPTLLSRYLTAAQRISRAAIGRSGRAAAGVTFRIPPDRTQQSHVEGLPLGTRGGGVFEHNFPQGGVYSVRIRLTRDRDEHVEGLHRSHEIDLLLDRELVHRFTVEPPEGNNREYKDFTKSDAHLNTRFNVTAGPHKIGVTFPAQSASLAETKRQPFDAAFNRHRHPRPEPAIFEVSLFGPLDDAEVNETPSRTRIFVARPEAPSEAVACAEKILSPLMRRAYRRPIGDDDLESPMRHFRDALASDGFEAGVEMALAAVLVNPHFLFRVESDPPAVEPGAAYRISDFELASRLSFFLWSSIPDDQLLRVAQRNQLHHPDQLQKQVLRMLGDHRARALATSFADQWLRLRNLESFSPDLRKFPDFDDNLRQAFRKETQLLFECVLREDRSVVDLLRADFGFLNERLARHYGVPHVYGSEFRRVALDDSSRRGGLLKHGSVLAVTSYATRTAPTIRGNWVLENILGTPAPPPPPNVPALEEKTALNNPTIRERLAEHRTNAACAVCHDLMDPIGFALEQYDAVGRWREFDDGRQIDASGQLPDGTELSGIDDLEAGLLRRPEVFVGTLTEKMLTYALGRGIGATDGPAVRRIVRAAADADYRFSSLVLGIASSTPFQMRSAHIPIQR